MFKKKLSLLLLFFLFLISSCDTEIKKPVEDCQCQECDDKEAISVLDDEKITKEVDFPIENRPLKIEEIPDEELKAICQQEEWPEDCSIIPVIEGVEMCKRCNSILPQKRTSPWQAFSQSKFPPCSSKKELFAVSHIPVAELQNIVPLGNLNPPGHIFPTNHLYFHLKGFRGDELSSSAPVVAPGDIWITRIGSSEYTMRGRDIKDYKLDFAACAEVKGYFIHLTSLSEKLLQSFAQDNCESYDTGGVHYKNCEKDFHFSSIFVEAGESIGTAGGSSDFGLADFRTQELEYANSNRWYEDPLHRVCPLDYFTEDIRLQLKSLLGSNDAKRTIEPICGEVAQDKPGTAQGVWFVKGTTSTYPEDPHLALVHDNINPLKVAFSIGTSLASHGLSGVYYFEPEQSGLVNRDFKDVFPDGKIYCYESLAKGFGSKASGRIILQLVDSKTLRIEGQAGNCASGSWAFNNYVEFER